MENNENIKPTSPIKKNLNIGAIVWICAASFGLSYLFGGRETIIGESFGALGFILSIVFIYKVSKKDTSSKTIETVSKPRSTTEIVILSIIIFLVAAFFILALWPLFRQ